jgi:predicted O-methyltransferase YrrM
MSEIKKFIKLVVPEPILRRVRLWRHAKTMRDFYFGRQLKAIKPILFETEEMHNFTYDLTDENLRYLAETIAIATDKTATEIESYVQEVLNNTELRSYFDARMASYKGQQSPESVKSPFGRRLGWYATVRAIKPRVTIETGVERGHGALLLCAAILQNTKEGFAGRYFGTDINPEAGWLLSEPYTSVGRLLIGDSISSLKNFSENVDLFVNDSDHSAEYEEQEYETIAPKLSVGAIILGDNAHVTDKLAVFSRKTGRNFLMFSEKPKDHWYPGGGIGISFPKSYSRTPRSD